MKKRRLVAARVPVTRFVPVFRLKAAPAIWFVPATQFAVQTIVVVIHLPGVHYMPVAVNQFVAVRGHAALDMDIIGIRAKLIDNGKLIILNNININQMEIVIRELQKNDLKKLMMLYRTLHPNDENIINQSILENFDEMQRNPHFTKYFVIELSDKIIASCCISVIPNLTRGGKPYAVIENVITDPDYRRNGYGTKIMKHAIDYARQSNCYKVMLLSNAKRKAAHQFYEKLGFDPEDKNGYIVKL